MDIRVPAIGDYADVPVVEIHVAPGDAVDVDAPLITLETDKATMDIPSPITGAIESISVRVGDTVSEGTVIAIASDGDGAAAPAADAAATEVGSPADMARSAAPADPAMETAAAPTPAAVNVPGRAGGPATEMYEAASHGLRATPLVRRLARDLEVDLATIDGTGGRGRVTKQDLLAHYKRSVSAATGAGSGVSAIPPIPEVDFAKFGPVRRVPLSRIKKLSGQHLHRSWLNVPHVTHADEADITDLDVYRRELDALAKPEGYRVTLLSFLLKAVASALRKFPEFNGSLAGDELVIKDYIHIGVAVDTTDGLVVPVVRDVERKGITELSQELNDLSARARGGKLTGFDLQGATFTISSLGGIGGTHFTPIVNAPEVAILGVVRSKTGPVWDGEQFVPRLMLPLCLSYDHRVIDGALAAKFTAHLARSIADVRRLVL